MSIPIIKESDLSPKHRDLWKKASKAARAQNYDYVEQLISSIVAAEPGFLDGRRVLRKAQIQRASSEKKGAFGGKFHAPNLGLMKIKSQITKDPNAAILALEEELAKAPTNKSANKMLYDAALAADMPELAAFALQTIIDGNPKDKDAMKELAKHYMICEEPDKALEMYNKVLSIDSSDLEAVKGVTDASARASMIKNKVEQGGVKRDADEARSLEMAGRQHLTAEQIEAQLAEWAPKYEEDPNNLPVVKKIADLYEKKEDWASALTYYDWAHQISDGDSALEAKVIRLRDKIRDIEFREMEASIEADPNAADIEQKRARMQELKQERLKEKLAEAQARVERNPTDPQLRFDLGNLYFQCGMHSEAIPELQRAKSNPHVRLKALAALGECFVKKNMTDLALNQYEEALKEAQTMDGTRKDLLYAKALVLESLDRKEDYLEALKEIYEADYGFRDVAQRVESSYAS